MAYLRRENSPALTDASQVLAAALKEMDSIIASAEVDNEEKNNDNNEHRSGHATKSSVLVYKSSERPSKLGSSYAMMKSTEQVDLESSLYNSDSYELTEQLSLKSENISLKRELFELQQLVAMQRAEINTLNQELLRERVQVKASEEQNFAEVKMRKKNEDERIRLMNDMSFIKLNLMRSEKERAELTSRLKTLQSGFQKTLRNLTAADLAGVRSSTPTRSIDASARPPLPRPPLSAVYSNTISASPSAQRRKDGRFQRFPQALYSTLPRNHKPSIHKQSPELLRDSNISVQQNDYQLQSCARSSSAPELANPCHVLKPVNAAAPTQPIICHTSGPKKLMKLFGKLSRSNSASNSSIGSFKRNTSIRATAMPRLCGWKSNEHLKKNLAEWDKKCIVSFFQQLDLYDLYDNQLMTVQNGQGLVALIKSDSFQTTIKHPLHKRKLLLAIDVFVQNDSLLKSAVCLDTKWSLSWLDDLGLSQYTDAFQEARIDGIILHNMTLEDAGVLKITSQLSLLSLKWGIHILRTTNFDPGCLKRRSTEKAKETLEEVSLWTNHRLMQWLRDIDLAEYAPNLRGSGVHGALLVYEDSLGEGLLAEILNISSSKTLLRKHLTQQLKSLLGDAIIQRKRRSEATSAAPLSPSTKIKFPKGTLGRRNKKKCDKTLVCPHDLTGVLPSGCDVMTTSTISTMTSSTHSSLSSGSTL